MKDFFRPELRNRIDMVCRFQKLDQLAIKKIVVKFIDDLKHSLKERNIRVNLTESAIELLAQRGYDPKMGARPLGRKIDELVKVPLSRKILFEKLQDCTLIVDAKEGEISLVTESHSAIPTAELNPVDTDGYIKLDRFRPKN
jgi:ATP-dependent Clp protease ATP-binding subunit ClpA